MDKIRSATWAGKPLEKQEHYLILDYLDRAKPVEIHKPDCSFVRELAWEQKDKTVPEYVSHLVIGTLQEALKRAEDLCVEKSRPNGWKKGVCCFKDANQSRFSGP